MQLINNAYQIQGISVTDLCREHGTPLYVYDGEKIVGQLNHLQQAFSGLKVRIKYAAKALTNQAILKLLKKAGSELDVVSIEEAELGLLAGYAPHEIMYAPNSVSFEEVQRAVELGISLNIDNLSILEKFGQRYGSSVPCCIRLNPHIAAGGNVKIQVGHVNSKFGISVDYLEEVHRVVKEYKITINGLHIHTGSDIKDAGVFLQMAQILFTAAMRFPDLQFLNFGSGFKVAYREGDHVLDVEELAKELKPAFIAFCERYGRELELWFEPGKIIVSESGYLLVRANVLKETPVSTIVGVGSGLNHLIRPMMYDAYHDIVNVSNPGGILKTYTVVGYICETDTFGNDRQLNEVREGDILALRNAGAYGFSMSSNYNSRVRPAEVLIYQGQAKLIRQRETIADLLRNQVAAEW